MLTFNHFNFNVSDLEKSLKFYKDALGLEPVRRKEAEDGSFVTEPVEKPYCWKIVRRVLPLCLRTCSAVAAIFC